MKTSAIGVILVLLIGLTVIGVLINSPFSDPLQVPPPSEPPGEEPEIVVENEVEIWAEAVYWQDFMPVIPEEGPPFYTAILLNVTNKGNATITYFHAIRVTIYFFNTSRALATLALESSIQYIIWPEIRPGESATFEFTNTRDNIFSPIIEEEAVLYSRILVSWDTGTEIILTTPPSALLYTH